MQKKEKEIQKSFTTVCDITIGKVTTESVNNVTYCTYLLTKCNIYASLTFVNSDV